jgi:transposase
MSLEQSMKFILGVETDQWKITGIQGGIEDDVKVTHIDMDFIGDSGRCPDCGCDRKIHDTKVRVWRHANLDDTVCYIHAAIPRCQCPKCGKISQVEIPWADPRVSYTKRFMEVAIEHMAQMSLSATSRLLKISWKVLDDIVGAVVEQHLDSMDLSSLRRIRVDETSAKKHHRYLTIVTDVDTGDIVFITKGKDSKTIGEFAVWLRDHKGDPDSIELIATDFGDAFIAGAREHLPNAEPVYDPVHLVQIANRHLDRDRASTQINGQRKKSIRYALLKNPDNLRPEEAEELMDITKDNELVGRSYQMKESLRQVFEYTKDEIDLARAHLVKWAQWAHDEGSSGFRALAKTVRGHIEGILKAIETGVNNGYQESLNGRVQLSKGLARGYSKEMRLGRIVFFRDSCRSL